MHDRTITVFNRIKGEAYESDTYIATVLTNVSVKHTYGARTTPNGEEKTDYMEFSINKDFIHDVSYREPKEYLAEENKDGLFTFAKGDIVVMDDVKSEVTEQSDLLNYLRNRYDNVFEIQSASDYTLIPHWEVIAV